LLEIPNRRSFDVFQPGTLNRERFYFLNLKPGTHQFRSETLLAVEEQGNCFDRRVSGGIPGGMIMMPWSPQALP
jgi:hypothetical protein